MKPQLRPARASDAPRLTRIAHAAKRHWGYPQAWILLWRRGLSVRPDHLRRHAVTVALVRGQIAGFASVRIAGRGASLEHLWILPVAMGQGIGRALLEHVLRTCARRGVRVLEVIADPNATGFYRDLGGRNAGMVRSAPAPRTLPRLRFVPMLGSRRSGNLRRGAP